MWNNLLPATLVVLSELILLAVPGAEAASAFPLIAGTKWLGVDGTWSHFDFRIGTNSAQTVSATVSTALSEIWVVQSAGCDNSHPLCTAARGGVYDLRSSRSWNSLGPWELGLSHLRVGGNGDYGQEYIMLNNPLQSRTLTLDNALVAGVNATSYFTGFIGVGATQGNFKDKAANPLINQLAQTTGEIPSHSYGYTAGAFYAGPNGALTTTENSGTPASLTLGGYDKNRFIPHDTSFNLPVNNPKPIQVPHVLLRGITAKVLSTDKAPTKDWNSTQRALYGMNESTTAIIDTSTPYLWLPPAVCDRFASALGLTWSDKYKHYTYPSVEHFSYFAQQTQLSFVFSMSSFDNKDNFGQPLDTRGVVNITLSSAAFAQSLKYPILEKFGDAAVPYFPLRRTEPGQPIVIGRVFMQEAYMITKYEANTFSIHQAKFPENPGSNMDIVDIASQPNSLFPQYEAPASSSGLQTAAIAGIAVAAVITIGVAGVVFWCCRRRKKRAEEKKKKATSTIGSDSTLKCSDSTMEPEPSSPIERIFSFLRRGRTTRRTPEPEESSKAVEVGADANHARFEMAAPLPPVELDGMDGTDIGDDTTELGTEGSQILSPYEIARRKMQRQLQGPVPTYTPPEPGTNIGTGDEKSERDVSPVAHFRPGDTVSAASSAPTYSQSGGSQRDTLPSPMSPNGDWTNRFDALPSPMTVAPPFPSPLFPSGGNGSGGASGSNHSNSDTAVSPQSLHHHSSADSLPSRSSSAASPSSLGPPPTGAYQRTPIDPSRVVCLGPLPENVQINSSSQFTAPTVPRLMMPDGRGRGRGAASGNNSAAIAAAAAAAAAGANGPSAPTISVSPAPEKAEAEDGENEDESGADTLGSNFTDDEEHEENRDAAQEAGQAQQQSPLSPNAPQSPMSPTSPHSINPGEELVHVPQMAERRYSWEEGTTQ